MSEDWFDAAPRELILRRALLALRLPPAGLARFGPARWRAFASRLAYWHALRRRTTPPEWQRATRGIPVLLYHAFGDEPSRFVIPTRVFARQMRLLALFRFRVVGYGELARALRDGRRRTVVLTLDDGYADNAAIAPILERHGFGATVFLVSGCLGGVNDWSDDAPLRGRPILSVSQLLALRERGFELAAHTRTHPALPDLDDEAVAPEVESSRSELEHALGVPVEFFAYPYGRADDRAVAAVRDAGFAGACTTDPRPARLADDALLVPRIEIKRSDSLLRFLTKVWFGGS